MGLFGGNFVFLSKSLIWSLIIQTVISSGLSNFKVIKFPVILKLKGHKRKVNFENIHYFLLWLSSLDRVGPARRAKVFACRKVCLARWVTLLFTFHLNCKYHPRGLINDMQMGMYNRKHWRARCPSRRWLATHPPSPASKSGSRLPSIFNSVCLGLVPGQIDSPYLIRKSLITIPRDEYYTSRQSKLSTVSYVNGSPSLVL